MLNTRNNDNRYQLLQVLIIIDSVTVLYILARNIYYYYITARMIILRKVTTTLQQIKRSTLPDGGCKISETTKTGGFLGSNC